MASGIKDKVAILGMGCARFGERWDTDADGLMVEAFEEAIADAGIEVSQLDAAWLGVGFDAQSTGPSGIPAAVALRLPDIGVTKVENYCASGTESLRGAVYAVASGAADIALAMGVEKLKDTGYGGLPTRTRGSRWDMIGVTGSAPGNFAQLASAYGAKHGIDRSDLKRAMAHVSVKSHANGAKNPKAHLRNLIDIDKALNAPMIAEPLGLFDCCGVSDGAACAIVTTPEIAKSLGKTDIVAIKAMQVVSSNGWEMQSNQWDGSYLHTTRVAATKAYKEAGITDPRGQLSLPPCVRHRGLLLAALGLCPLGVLVGVLARVWCCCTPSLFLLLRIPALLVRPRAAQPPLLLRSQRLPFLHAVHGCV